MKLYHLRIFVASISYSLAAALAYPFEILGRVIHELAPLSPTAAEVASMGCIAPQPGGDDPKPRSRFRSYLTRALTHPAFTAGRFDPGRMPA